MKKSALVVDYKYCTGCHSCEVACRQEKRFPIGEWGIKLNEQGPVKLGDQWMWNNVPIPSDLCDLCAERIAAGKRPACVLHCLAKCMELVAIEDLPATLVEKGDSLAVFVPKGC